VRLKAKGLGALIDQHLGRMAKLGRAERRIHRQGSDGEHHPSAAFS
jgi:hypothetical protein